MSSRNRAIVFLFIFIASAALVAAAEIRLTALTLRANTPITVNFVRTNRAPGRSGLSASLDVIGGQSVIDLKFQRMEPAVLFAGDITTFVLWAVSIDGTVDNLGDLVVENKSSSGSQRFTTPRRVFALMLTAEPFAAVRRPTEYVLFRSGEVGMKNITNTPFTFANFATGPKPALDSIAMIQYNDSTPATFRQAQKVLQSAWDMKAAEVDPKAVKDAEQSLGEAESLLKSRGNKKTISDLSRIAAQKASKAILAKIEADEAKAAAEAEAKRLAERAALEQRANTAESESERIARELKEVEAQKAALAQESQSLANELTKLAADKEALARERDVLAADREKIKKERDELAGMLKGALSSVAETNETARGVVVNLPGILFDVGESTLTLPAQLTVAKLAGILMVFQNMKLSVEGHTDSTGSLELNMKLSEDRARAVYAFLRGQGIPESRMRYEGFGPNRPVAPNDVEFNRAKNRRVEVVLTEIQRAP
jgi:outer membrane protein OmpA-like peptidoglycan-associated protein